MTCEHIERIDDQIGDALPFLRTHRASLMR